MNRAGETFFKTCQVAGDHKCARCIIETHCMPNLTRRNQTEPTKGAKK